MPHTIPPTPANPQPAPINRYSARSSYYGASGYSPSEGLKRARRPFRARNAITGLAILGFAASVYGYSISAVKQDDFSDLPSTSTLAESENVKTIDEELREKSKMGGSMRGAGAIPGIGSSPQGEGLRIGTTSIINTVTGNQQQQHPTAPPAEPGSVAEAAASSLVTSAPLPTGSRPKSRFIVGAPDVDRVGKLWERIDESDISGRRVV